MRRSPLRHNLARLRFKVLKLGQKEMAELCGCSVDTIQSIELGRLALSESLARKISNETGIAWQWLLGNDLKAPLLGDTMETFTIEYYNERRSLRDLGLPTHRGAHVWASGGEPGTIIFYAWMRSIFHSKDGDIALWQTGKFLEKLAKRYGHSRPTPELKALPDELSVAALRDHNVRWQQAEIGMRLAEKYARKWRKGKLRRGKHGGLIVPSRPRSRSSRRQR